jgi:hypothetical protein
MGLFSIFLAGGAAARRDTRPEGAQAGEALAATNWRATADEDGHYCFAVTL